MIITPYFAWGHLPKTAGDYTFALFHLFPDLIQHADPVDTDDKHALFVDRLEALSGKELVLNIRRLPAWILSYSHHRSRFGEYPDYAPMGMLSLHEMTSLPLGDENLTNFTANGQLTINRWLRVEHLAADILDLIGDFTEVSATQKQAVSLVDRVNTQTYDRELRHWFTEEQVTAMYRSNPVWAAVEREAYGNEIRL